jgi:hypothetical protein
VKLFATAIFANAWRKGLLLRIHGSGLPQCTYIDDELEKKWTQHEDLKQLFFLPPHDAAIIVPPAMNIYVE